MVTEREGESLGDDGEAPDADAPDPDGSAVADAARRAINRSRRLASRLTNQQWRFALALASQSVPRGGRLDPAAAARAAGYQSPHVAAHRLLLAPHVAEVIGELAASDLRTRLPIAVQTLVDLMGSNDESIRLQAARLALTLGWDMLPSRRRTREPSPAVAVQINNEAGAIARGGGQALIREVWRDRLARPAEPNPVLDAVRAERDALGDDSDGA